MRKEPPKQILKTAFFTGFLAILPIGLLVIILVWLYRLLMRFVLPFTNIIHSSPLITALIVIGGMIISIVLVGLVVHTGIGYWFRNRIETHVLSHVPGYKTVKKVIEPFGAKPGEKFKSVALVELFENSVLATGFITDQTKDRVTVFIPTGPNPTSGQIFHLKKKFVHPINISVDKVLSCTFAVGNGSAEILEKMQENKKNSNISTMKKSITRKTTKTKKNKTENKQASKAKITKKRTTKKQTSTKRKK